METFEWVFRKDIGGRKEQQDNGCVFVQDKVLLAAVADGLPLAQKNIVKSPARCCIPLGNDLSSKKYG